MLKYQLWQSVKTMNQEEALKIMKMGANVFLTGIPGAGKTYILNQYIDFMRRAGLSPSVTASTGIASTHIGGATIHSWSGIGIKKSFSDIDIDKLTQNERLYQRYKNAKILIIDEISMLSASQFEMIDVLAREMRQNDKPFGGIRVILSGDFFQLPPVSRPGDDDRYAFESPVWRELNPVVCYLLGTYRHEDDVLKKILDSIRRRDISQDLRRKLFSKIEEKNWERDNSLKDVTRLYTHNADVDRENEARLGQIKKEEFSYEMKTRGKKHLAESLKKWCLAPENLRLKEGAQVMFVKNDTQKRYVNGTRGMVIGKEGGLPVVKTLSGKKILAEYAEWVFEEDGRVVAQIEQIPLRLAWAITVHKSQGMTLDEAHINLSKSFTPGQGYVGLSRIKSMSGLFLSGLNEEALMVDERAARADRNFLDRSKMASDKIKEMNKNEIKKKIGKFLKEGGGKAPKGKDFSDSAYCSARVKPLETNLSTYDETAKFVKKEYSIKEIAKKRELKEATIISHLEKLKSGGTKDFDIGYMSPGIKADIKEFSKMEKAFKKVGEYKLSPIKKYLDKKGIDNTYNDLRLVRLMLSNRDFKSFKLKDFDKEK
ncbi:helicase [Candidatus Campbellbacteria bacterium CG22_combo_CG10-13_8_21_14_all_43_18]|uniref:Helicase n=1 Tax=Candidatus Campbellbacteria bacterium CG22_combo_CG10-13_8_21_14_all_43_18 TaxID=1974530 RepID=A0A2H0DX81_9BACT|nr:MAG: helicase [Candidatus Campbellbacteria bacterium CG22_combo_CG10-13_8_21_14_all_43_18]